MAMGKASISYPTRLKKKNEELRGSPSLGGQCYMTFVNMINGMRVNMNTSHQKQFVALLNPDITRVLTGMENIAGKYSSGYKKANSRLSVFRKIVKYKDIVETPQVYTLITYDPNTGKYSVVTRKPLEKLTEKFAYEYDNSFIDSLEEKDIVNADDILYKSRSYDNDMNFRYGANVTVAYTVFPYTTEDAAQCSQWLHDKCKSVESDTIEMSLNDNDYLLNLYGDKNEYRALPKIGEMVKTGPILSSRRLQNDQFIYDFKASNLLSIKPGDTTKYNTCDSTVIDYDIYCNADEMKVNTFTKEILELLESQTRYYEEIIETHDIIVNEYKGKISKDFDYLYKRALEFTDPKHEKKWKDNDNAFGNVIIKIHTSAEMCLTKGCKITGREGNKSVIANVVPNYMMPYTEDGRRVDLLLNLCSIVNRTTPFVLYELAMTHAQYYIRKYMSVAKTLKEQELLYFKSFKLLSEETYDQIHDIYFGLNLDKKKAFMKEVIDEGFYMTQPPMWEKTPLIDRLAQLYKEFPFIKADKMYCYQYGQYVRLLRDAYVGQMYIIKLKQSDSRGASVRASGAINNKNEPTRSQNPHDSNMVVRDSIIRFGEYEFIALMIVLHGAPFAIIKAMLRTSQKARRDIFMRSLKDLSVDTASREIDGPYNSLAAEIVNVYFKSLGIEVTFKKVDEQVIPLDNTISKPHNINDKVMFTTTRQAWMLSKYFSYQREVFISMGKPMNHKEMQKHIIDRLNMDSDAEGLNIKYGPKDLECLDDIMHMTY